LPLDYDKLTLEALREAFAKDGYIAGENILVPVYLALQLGKPLLIEGEPGVGKTEIAKVLARVFSAELIRLQCYEGLDENRALYEWNYQRQLLKIQITKDRLDPEEVEQDLFSEEYLLTRPLLKALLAEKRPVLLIDEVDKTDAEFEAFLFEVLSDFQVSIPELGTVTARQIPIVVLTSNRSRELSDGLKRRCIYLYIDFPSVEREVEIIRAKVPEVGEVLRRQLARAIHHVRELPDMRKKPSIAETLDWARALVAMDVERLEPKVIEDTINLFLKNKDDIEAFFKEIGAENLARLATAEG